MGEYEKFHPGGKFTLSKNVGRDISKYFYGAYKLVNLPNEELHSHSPSAMAIANSMIIGHLKGQGELRKIKVNLVETKKINSVANYFKFKTDDQNQIKPFKSWYSDISVIG